MSADPREDLRILRRVTECLSNAHTLEAALLEITDAALVLLPGDHASLRLLDASGRRLLAAARSGAGTEQRSLTLTRGEGIAGWVVEHGKPVRIAHADRDPRFLAAVGQGFEIRSIIAEPLLSTGKAIGVLSVSSAEADVFSESDEQLARILANCSVPRLEKDRLERLALSDELTLAFNANYLDPRLAEEMERAHHSGAPLSVLAMDFDNLDRFTSTFGRELGDSLLSLFASRMRALLRSYDSFIRWGEREFVVVLPNTSPVQAMAMAERMRATMANEAMEPIAGALVTQTITIGMATWNGRENREELLYRTAVAVREGKVAGGNAVVRASVRE
jgi:diguanylate cyclase (GGDEF)-like protein